VTTASTRYLQEGGQSRQRGDAGPLLLSLADEQSCAHDKLVFDEINDVYCKHCGKDFTG
jgi:hypothetical protein